MGHELASDWTLPWMLKARRVPHGGVVAGLLVDLAADARQIHVVHTVQFPLRRAARALGAHPLIVRTSLHQLAEAGMLQFEIDDDHATDEQHVTVHVTPTTSSSAV